MLLIGVISCFLDLSLAMLVTQLAAGVVAIEFELTVVWVLPR
jgi:hypothetical protein